MKQKPLLNDDYKRYDMTLEWPPSVNKYWGHRPHPLLPNLAKQAILLVKNGNLAMAIDSLKKIQKLSTFTQRYVTKEGKDYKQYVAWQIKAYKYHDLAKTELLGRKLKLTVFAYPPRNNVYDLGNLDKILGDSLQDSGMIRNDVDIDDLRFVRMEKCVPGKVRVVLETI